MDYLDIAIVEKLKDYAIYEDLDIKALALAGLHYSQYKNKEIRNYLMSEIGKLGDNQESVRRRWGLILDYFGTVYFLSVDKNKAAECYQLASEVLPNDPTIIDNLSKARS